MGTGIVSVTLADAGRESVSRGFFALCGGTLLGLAAVVATHALHDRPRLVRDTRTPAALTAAAAPAVAGARVLMLGWHQVAVALLLVAALTWAWLMPRVLRHWRAPAEGAGFIVVVATEALAVLAASLADREATAWLLDVALCAVIAGVGLYVWVALRFEVHQLIAGRGDHWVAGGALAISALACAEVTQAASDLDQLRAIDGALGAGAVALWAVAVAWLPVLLTAEVIAPRPRYDVRRWSTVFPVGMYAAATFAVGTVSGTAWMGDAARAWTWVACALWLAVAAGTVRRTAQALRTPPPGDGAQGEG